MQQGTRRQGGTIHVAAHVEDTLLILTMSIGDGSGPVAGGRKLDQAQLRTGSDRPWTSGSADRLLVRKP